MHATFCNILIVLKYNIGEMLLSAVVTFTIHKNRRRNGKLKCEVFYVTVYGQRLCTYYGDINLMFDLDRHKVLYGLMPENIHT